MRKLHLVFVLLGLAVFLDMPCMAQITIIGGVQPSESRRPRNVLSNSDVLRMVKAKISAPNIVHTIEQNQCSFDTSPTALVQLKSQGVSEAVLAAMLDAAEGMNHNGRPQEAQVAPPQNQLSKTGASLPTEAGLYYRDGNKWIAVPAELATTRQTGRFATAVSEGIAKVKFFGVLQKSHSALRVPSSVELLLYRTEATQADEYELVELTSRHETREFQYGEAGGFALMLGANPNIRVPHALNFQCEQVSARICKIKAELTKGDFGLIAPGLPAGATGDFIARVYTFAVQ